jgi:DNA-binding GntR family transcriptional regulator
MGPTGADDRTIQTHALIIGPDPQVSAPPELVLEDRPRSLSDLVYDAIYRAIVNKVMAPGEVLTEPGMAVRLKVSKTPVREAFLRLRQVGLIEVDGPRGLRVVQFSRAKLEQAYELREALEPFMAAACAQRASAGTLEAISAFANASVRSAKDSDLHSFRENDTAFHSAIAAAVDNPRITDANEGARALIATLRQRDFPHAHGVLTCAAEHAAIASAITERDAERAHAEMATHIRNTRALMLSSASLDDERPISGRRFAPNTSRTTSNSIRM